MYELGQANDHLPREFLDAWAILYSGDLSMRWTYLIRWGMRISLRKPAIKRRNTQFLLSITASSF